jgi:branched-chain amino acid transport system permease protein
MLSFLSDLKGPIMNGLLLGGLYGIVGIGMSLIFGIVRVVNLAHGDLVILASYLSLVTLSIFNVSPLLTLILVIPAMFLIGFLIQYYLVNRVLGQGMNPPLLVAFGLSIILQNLLLLVFTPDARALLTSISIATLPIGNFINIPVVYLVDFIGSLLTILLLSRFFNRTYLGKAIRAASDDEGAAQLMGINTKKIYAWAMAIAGGTAAIAGVLVGMTFTFYPHTGPDYLIIAFGVVIIGGLGSLIGTFLGGLILGLAQILGAHFSFSQVTLSYSSFWPSNQPDFLRRDETRNETFSVKTPLWNRHRRPGVGLSPLLGIPLLGPRCFALLPQPRHGTDVEPSRRIFGPHLSRTAGLRGAGRLQPRRLFHVLRFSHRVKHSHRGNHLRPFRPPYVGTDLQNERGLLCHRDLDGR